MARKRKAFIEENEYGAELDLSGYAPSIVDNGLGRCYLCGAKGYRALQRHEIFGASNRERSKLFGLWVNLCGPCHYDITFVHVSSRHKLKETGQKAAMDRYGWTKEEFIRRFGKSYLD